MPIAKAKKHLDVDHVYSLYALYQITHFRPFGYRVTEIEGILSLVEQHRERWPKLKTKMKGLNVYELLAGQGEYEQAWKALHTGVPSVPLAESYWSVEGVKPDREGNHYVGDVCSFVPPTDHNLILSPYYSVDSVLDFNTPEFRPTRRAVADTIKTSGQVLKKSGGGWFYGHFTPQPDLTYLSMGINQYTLRIPTNADLRKLFAIRPDEAAELDVDNVTYYDRTTGMIQEHYNRFAIRVGKKVLGTIDVKNPFSYRYYLDQDIIDMLQQGGFDCKHTLWAYFDPSVNVPMAVLPQRVQEPTDLSETNFFPNCFLAYMPG